MTTGLPKASGIYRIVCDANGGRTYIGSSSNMRARWATHKSSLQRGKHGNRHLQRAWIKYGEGAFRFEVVEMVPVELLLDTEQRYIDECGDGFNICPIAGSNRGHKPSAEARAKMSAARMGHRHSAETREKIGAGNRGKTVSEASRAKMSVAKRGRVVDRDVMAKTWAANIGRKPSAESRAKMSAAKRGRVVGAATRAKISAIRRGTVASDETRARMSAAQCARQAAQRDRRNNG